MKVTYLHQYFVPPGGSGGTRSLEIARALIGRGHSVRMVTSSAFFPEEKLDLSTEQWRDVEGIECVVLGSSYSNRQQYWRRIFSFLKYSFESSWIAARTPADVIYASSTPLTVAVPALIASRFRGIPFVFEVRDLWPEAPIAMGALRNPLAIWLARRLSKYTYERAARIVALSPYMVEGIEKVGTPSSKILLAPNMSNIERLADVEPERPPLEALRADHKLIICAGTIGIANDVEYLVGLAAELKSLSHPCSIVVVGEGKQVRSVLSEATRLGVLNDNFFLVEPQPKERVWAWTKAADLAACTFADNPVLFGNSPNKFFDALAAGCPPLINFGGWMSDLLRETGCGVIVGRDPARAAIAVASFLDDPARVAEARLSALELAEEFDTRRICSSIVELVEHVADSSSASCQDR